MKKILIALMVPALFLTPFAPLKAYYDSYYTFRSTVTGTSVRNAGNYVYEIQNKKNEFKEDETVYFLTRIFNIGNAGHFKFKHVISGNNYNKEIYSHDFWPNRNWWAEVYYYNSISNLSAGSYDIKTYISVDNEAYRHLNTHSFRILSPSHQDYYYGQYSGYGYDYPYYYQPAYSYPYQDDNYYDSSYYEFKWLKTGQGVRGYDRYKYQITGEGSLFSSNNDIHALVYLANIRNVDRFQVKFEVYRGNSFYLRKTVPIAYPHNTPWEYNYSWANLGKMAQGEYEIRAYVSINGASYRHLTSRKIQVGSRYSDDYHYYPGYGYPYEQASYKYNWTKYGTDVKFLGNYNYDLSGDRTVFWTDERVKALTRLYDIYNIGYFQIRHKLYKENSLKQTKTSDIRRPNNRYWQYNYFDSDFGYLEAGDYYVKVFISVEGGTYKHLGTRNFTVKNRYGHPYPPYYPDDQHYRYGGTIVGTSYPTRYYGDYNQGYY